jgi:hypothetical protein
MPGPPGPQGPPGKDGETKIIREVVEKAADLSEITGELKALRAELDRVKKRKTEPSHTVGGQASSTKYVVQTESEIHWKKDSFINGITVIGVRYNGAATVYLPNNLDPTMLVSVKDEAGSGNITIIVE